MITKRQQEDIESIKYFIPDEYSSVSISENDIEDFLAYSEKGEKRRDGSYDKFRKVNNGFDALIQGKIRRGLNMGLWKDGVLEGSTPYITLLGGYSMKRKWWQLWKDTFVHEPIPVGVMKFMSKEMFKGVDKKIIEELYSEIVDEHKWWRRF